MQQQHNLHMGTIVKHVSTHVQVAWAHGGGGGGGGGVRVCARGRFRCIGVDLAMGNRKVVSCTLHYKEAAPCSADAE